MDDQVLENLIGILVVCFIIFMICRELVCWYWKLNRIVSLLESINKKLGGEPAVSDKIDSVLAKAKQSIKTALDGPAAAQDSSPVTTTNNSTTSQQTPTTGEK